MSIDLRTFEPRKILVCQLRQIGDVVISTACIELLARRYPGARIDLLTEDRSAPLVRHNPRLGTTWEARRGSGFWSSLLLSLKIRAAGYDLVVDFQRLFRCRLAVLFSGARVKLTGPGKWYDRLFYTHFGGFPKGGYAGKLKASVLAPLGIAWNSQKPRVYLTEDERRWAAAHLAEQGLRPGDLLVTVDPTHRSVTRRWPQHYYADLLARAARERGDLKFYLLYGPGERETVEAIIRDSGLPAGRVLLPPRDHEPRLREMAAVIGQAALHFGNCSAPRHVAVALDVQTLTMIGSNGPSAWTFPSAEHECCRLYLPCQKCGEEECPRGTLDCLLQQTPDMVLPRLLKKLPQRAEI
jgi:ADP-heptose:LPS heptosyltransferase